MGQYCILEIISVTLIQIQVFLLIFYVCLILNITFVTISIKYCLTSNYL
nr:MAG TPA: hypothetical protein [Caudoviricetes sp.]